jgi:hypothetical protein
MYMWLVLVTCAAWGLLFSRARAANRWKLVAYTLCLIAMVYSHPLGLLMVAALGLAPLIFRQTLQISWRGWFMTQFAVFLSVAPWMGQYLDHAPESTSGLLPIRFLLGMPIGFIGGNFMVLLVCLLLIAYGLFKRDGEGSERARLGLDHPCASISLLIWIVVPTLLLYTYSRLAHPIFGPARYTLFVGPAYLLLVARGLGKLPWPLGLATALAGVMLSGAMLISDVYRPGLKADWRDLAAYLDQRDPGAVIAVISAEHSGNTEVETARYYLARDRIVAPWSDGLPALPGGQKPTWAAIGLDAGRPVRELPHTLTSDKQIRESIDFARLRLMRIDFHQRATSAE